METYPLLIPHWQFTASMGVGDDWYVATRVRGNDARPRPEIAALPASTVSSKLAEGGWSPLPVRARAPDELVSKTWDRRVSVSCRSPPTVYILEASKLYQVESVASSTHQLEPSSHRR
jgi:hypothetical protein